MSEPYKRPARRRDGSGELDVFEATRYFSGGCVEESAAWEGMEGKSLEVHVRSPVPSKSLRVEKLMKEKKLKQPLSPGGRLASFLNSFFHHAAGSKKKSKSKSSKSNSGTTLSVKDKEEDRPAGGRIKRRNSLSQSQSPRNSESKSIYSCPGSGFRTPPPYINTPLKACKDVSIHPNVKSSGMDSMGGRSKHNEGFVEKNRLSITEFSEEKGLNISTGFVEKRWVLNKNREGSLEEVACLGGLTPRQKNLWRSEEIVDGAESDSSSDLFDLPNYDLGGFSSGPPVYETTTVKSNKRGTSLASSAF